MFIYYKTIKHLFDKGYGQETLLHFHLYLEFKSADRHFPNERVSNSTFIGCGTPSIDCTNTMINQAMPA